MIRSSSTLFSLLLLVALVPQHVVLGFSPIIRPSTTNKVVTGLKMSDVPRDGGAPSWSAKFKKWKDVLPPSPEDQFVMTGDVAALFVYSFLDHSMNGWYVDSVLQESNSATVQALDPLGELSASNLPVWFDTLHTATNMSAERLFLLLGLQDVAYSPILATAGSASVAITTCWLLSGWINRAFSFQNTVECTQTRALEVTGKSWVGACLLMISLALGSDFFWGHCNCLHSPSLNGLTKADADYIFDSLSVLVTWRFIVSWLLGSGGK